MHSCYKCLYNASKHVWTHFTCKVNTLCLAGYIIAAQGIPILPQYTMLSGHVPFLKARLSGDNSARQIMRRIEEGDFSLEGSEWKSVSMPAQSLIKGL